eukprot:6441415-Pyramimonas_sp.AAC.1
MVNASGSAPTNDLNARAKATLFDWLSTLPWRLDEPQQDRAHITRSMRKHTLGKSRTRSGSSELPNGWDRRMLVSLKPTSCPIFFQRSSLCNIQAPPSFCAPWSPRLLTSMMKLTQMRPSTENLWNNAQFTEMAGEPGTALQITKGFVSWLPRRAASVIMSPEGH